MCYKSTFNARGMLGKFKQCTFFGVHCCFKGELEGGKRIKGRSLC